MCPCIGQTNDVFHAPGLQSELSQDNNNDDNDDNDDDDDDDNGGDYIVNDTEPDDDPGAGSGDEDTMVQTALHSEDVLVTPPQRQPSTTEYLPGMLHTNSPLGLLPKFPSWSLLQLGEYSSYNPSTGNCRILIYSATSL